MKSGALPIRLLEEWRKRQSPATRSRGTKMKKSGWSRYSQLLQQEDGQDVVEYALVLTFVALGAVACLSGLASTLSWIANLGAYVMSTI